MGHGPYVTLFFGYIWEEAFPDEIVEAQADWKRLDELEKQFGVEFGVHGSDEYPMHFVSVKELTISPYAYENAEVNPQMLNLSELERQEANDKILGFLDELNVSVDDAAGPGWYIAPFYG